MKTMSFLSKRNLAVGFAVLTFFVGFIVGSFYSYQNSKISKNETRTTSLDHATIIISNGESHPIVWANKIIPNGASLFEILKAFTLENKIEFSYKDYGQGMGVFINSFASSTNTKDKWWQYWVNGDYASLGVSSYNPKDGDVIEFRLTGEIMKND